jgi:hypothetical protein
MMRMVGVSCSTCAALTFIFGRPSGLMAAVQKLRGTHVQLLPALLPCLSSGMEEDGDEEDEEEEEEA